VFAVEAKVWRTLRVVIIKKQAQKNKTKKDKLRHFIFVYFKKESAK
jgi:hypothetical protein